MSGLHARVCPRIHGLCSRDLGFWLCPSHTPTPATSPPPAWEGSLRPAKLCDVGMATLPTGLARARLSWYSYKHHRLVR